MRPASAKGKGRRLAKKVKALFHKTFPRLENEDIHVVPSGMTGPDLWFSPRANRNMKITVECKNVEKLNIWEALAQSEAHAEDSDKVPLLFFSRNHSKVYVALDAEEFMMLWQSLDSHLEDDDDDENDTE